MKKVLAIISLLFLVLNGNAQESLDTIKSFRLSEVVVKQKGLFIRVITMYYIYQTTIKSLVQML